VKKNSKLKHFSTETQAFKKNSRNQKISPNRIANLSKSTIIFTNKLWKPYILRRVDQLDTMFFWAFQVCSKTFCDFKMIFFARKKSEDF